ncbi:hypothetical protein CsSME_00007811 [Camellia sinensis var. sinensis]
MMMRHMSDLEVEVPTEQFRDQKCTFLELFQVPGTLIFLKICRELDLLKMAGNSPHGGGFPGAGDDFDPMTLPPRTRPFIPGSFDERAPGDLLLRELEHHLSHEAREVGSRSVRGYGSTIARDWYAELPEGVRDLVDLAGFEPFCVGLSRCPARRTLMAALVERWWDTTNSFHFSATGDMTMTPLDFAVLTGLDIGGWSIPYDEDMGEWETAWMYLLGARPPVDRVSGRVRYTWFSSHFRRAEMVPETPEETEQYARGFLMFLFGTTLFADRGNTVGLYLLSALVDLSQVHRYNWGGAGLATLYFYMSVTSRGRGDLLGGYWRAWEVLFLHFYSLYFALSISYLHSALLFSAMGLCILSIISPRVGGGRGSHDPILTGTSELAVPFIFIFDLLCIFLISDWFMHLSSADHMAALGVGSRSVRGYGSTIARDWYAELPKGVRDLVDLAGFGPFCVGLSRCPARRTLMAALVERWWDTTNSFHFSASGDMTMTPLDFAVLTGLDIGGWSIPYDEDMGESSENGG